MKSTTIAKKKGMRRTAPIASTHRFQKATTKEKTLSNKQQFSIITTENGRRAIMQGLCMIPRALCSVKITI
jgi:hypothetical protein